MSPAKTPTKLTFAQGLMLFFVQKILDEHTMSTFFGDDNTNKFLIQWSAIVSEGLKKNENFPCTVEVPENFGKEMPKEMDLEEKTKRRLDKTLTPFAPEEYRPLLTNPQFAPLLSLLSDEDLGRLMQIEYSTEVAELAKETAPAPKAEGKDADIIREAVARKLNKKPEELTTKDYEKITELDLSGTQVSDLTPLKKLTNLQTLALEGTQVSDFTPIKELIGLQRLFLTDTQVSDLTPIKTLIGLQRLSLTGTQVSDLTPIKELTNLQVLYLYGTQVSDEQVSELKKALPELTIHR